MAGRVIDATLRFVDNFTKPFTNTINQMTNGSKHAVKLGKEIDKAGQTISNVGGKLTKSVTLPIVGLGAAAVKTAADFESSMSNVKAIMGEKYDSSLADFAQELGATTAWSAQEVAQAMQYTGMAGWDAKQNIAGLKGILDLASASGTELATTSDILTDAITAFGDAAGDAGRYADVMTAASTNANVNVELLGESYKYVGALAGTMKYSVEDVTTALAAMGNAGVKGSTAGTALRSAITNMSAPTKEMQAAMDSLGISLTNSDGTMKSFKEVVDSCRNAFSGLDESSQAAYAKQIFGKQAMAGMLSLINTSADEYNALSDAISNSGGAADTAAKTQLDNLKGQLTLLKSATEGIAISFGNKLMPALKGAVAFAQGLADKINNLSEEQVNLIIKIAGVAAAVGPALMVFGKMVSMVGKAIIIFNKLKGLMALKGVVGLFATPVGIAVGAIVGLIAVGVLLYKNWDTVKEKAQQFMGYLKNVFSGVSPMTDKLKESFLGVKDKFSEFVGSVSVLWETVRPVVFKIGEVIKTVFGVVVGGAIGGAIGYFTSFLTSASEIVGNVIGMFTGITDFLQGVFTGNWSQAMEGIKTIFSNAFNALVGLCKTPLNAVIGLINGAISGINNLGFTVPDWVPKLGGKSISINIPTIPALARGTDNWRGGLAQISERGGEIVDLPKGSRVYPAEETKKMLNKQGMTFNLDKLADKIIVREEADIDKIAYALEKKLTKISLNMGVC